MYVVIIVLVCDCFIDWYSGGSGLDMPSVHFFCNHSFHQVFSSLSHFFHLRRNFMLCSVVWEILTKFVPFASEQIERSQETPTTLLFRTRCLPIFEAFQVFEMKKSLEIPGDLHEQFFRFVAIRP
jgi:hypothetical protein